MFDVPAARIPDVPSRQPVSHKLQFGQLNYCFRLRMRGDPLVDGLAFACVSTRATNYVRNRWHHCIANVKHGSNTVFVCVNDIESTALALHALDANDKFILKMNAKRGYNNIQDLEDINKIYAPRLPPPPHLRNDEDELQDSKLDPILAKLFFIELHPERLKLTYGNIRDDVDKTKQREDKSKFVKTRKRDSQT
jgi:hypothetical protein